MIYLSEEEFRFLGLKRLDFLKRGRSFVEKSLEGRLGGKNEAIGGCINEDLRGRIHNYTPCYEATDIHATRDSLFWSWRRVKEYYRELEEDLDNQMKELKKLIRR